MIIRLTSWHDMPAQEKWKQDASSYQNLASAHVSPD